MNELKGREKPAPHEAAAFRRGLDRRPLDVTLRQTKEPADDYMGSTPLRGDARNGTWARPGRFLPPGGMGAFRNLRSGRPSGYGIGDAETSHDLALVPCADCEHSVSGYRHVCSRKYGTASTHISAGLIQAVTAECSDGLRHRHPSTRVSSRSCALPATVRTATALRH